MMEIRLVEAFAKACSEGLMASSPMLRWFARSPSEERV